MLLDVTSETLLQVFGRFHIVLLHLPIGLLPAMFVLEFGAAILGRPIPKGALMTLAVMTALTAAATFGSGLVLAQEKIDSETLGLHKNFAVAMASCSLLLPLLAWRSRRAPFRVALAASLALSIPTGHYGGDLSHKKNFLFKPLQRQTAPARGADQPSPRDGSPAPPPSEPLKAPTPTAAAGGEPPTAEEVTRYERDIAPIMERCCTSCHNPEEPDGDLDLSSREAVLVGWGDGETIVEPGDPDASILLESLGRPDDDEMRMPPADEDEQLTPAEIEKIRKWILTGCPE